ncbi:MAG TPA: hypothetical protein VFA81_01925 [Burkholderiales bacterium]|nr:hypothetical protein [Burkholderiales bacterium]
MRMILVPLVAGSLMAVCLGCGASSQSVTTTRALTGADVTAAFAAAGVPLLSFGRMAGIADYWAATFSRGEGTAWIDVQVFPTVQRAQYSAAMGAYIEDSNGNPIAPLARVANVTVTLTAKVSQARRQRVLTAVSRLRKQASG